MNGKTIYKARWSTDKVTFSNNNLYEGLKEEEKLRKRMEDERDEERIHRQLREMNDDVHKEKQTPGSFKRK